MDEEQFLWQVRRSRDSNKSPGKITTKNILSYIHKRPKILSLWRIKYILKSKKLTDSLVFLKVTK